MEEPRRIHLQVEGMHCTNCALGVEQALHSTGLTDASVNFASRLASFTVVKNEDVPKAISRIQELGYSVRESIHKRAPLLSVQTKCIIAVIFTAPLLLHMVYPLVGVDEPLVQFLLTVPVLIMGLLQFLRSAVASLRARVPNMESLVLLGSVSGFIYSVLAWAGYGSIEHLFFETTASIITFMLIGQVMEARAIESTASTIRALLDLRPTEARRIVTTGIDEQIETIDPRIIEEGDILIVNTGDRIPADGIIIEGEADVDESMATGESIPVHHIVDSSLLGGTIVISGSIKLKAISSGEKSFVSKVIQLTEDALSHRPSIQKLADRISAVFVPTVLTIGILTFIIWHFFAGIPIHTAFLRALAVLVISCPCAMGLATPTAMMVAVGRAAKLGILLKRSEALHSLSVADKVIFDKTGTLTTGQHTVEKLTVIHGEEKWIRATIRSIEARSSHPIARSIEAAFSSEPFVPLVSFSEQPGRGVVAQDKMGNTYEFGSKAILSGQMSGEDHSVYLLQNGELIAWLDLGEELRKEAGTVIQDLKSNNFAVMLMSGDTRERCEVVADRVGIDEVASETSPERKLETIIDESKSHAVIYVGDGINDAPALAASLVSVSLNRASDIALAQSDVILMNEDLSRLPLAIKLGKLTMKTVRQNLSWAFFYNIIAIPFAAFGLIHPMFAAIIMAVSDIVVVGNSILLRVVKIEGENVK